jgi:hypothetical protein
MSEDISRDPCSFHVQPVWTLNGNSVPLETRQYQT